MLPNVTAPLLFICRVARFDRHCEVSHDPAMQTGIPDDAWVYRRARQLIEQHGDDAMMVATLLVGMALKRREKERAALMLRVRAVVAKLQEAQSGPVH